MRMIDADALLESLKESAIGCREWKEEAQDEEVKIRADQARGTFIECALRVKNAPTIEAEHVRHGRWIEGTSRGSFSIYCSYCGSYKETICPSDYCPNCGARMDATDTNVGGKGDEEMDLSPLDFLAAEYDRKHPQGIRFVDCMEGADDGACKKV